MTHEYGQVFEELAQRVATRSAQVAVVGMGYVGMPLACAAADAGFPTVGIDVNVQRVAAINAGDSYVQDVPSERLARLVSQGALRASADFADTAAADCILIAVPTPLTKTKAPDIGPITAAIDGILPHVRAGQLVVLESTTYPGTTEELLASRVVREKGLVVGADVFVAFSPERVDPGNPVWHTENTPKVVGGVTAACTEMARRFYGHFIDTVHPVAGAKEAETVKLLENTFRAVNIAMVNEFLQMCRRMGIDPWPVIDAAATKPFGFMRFDPGPGIGGHCIPLDPVYLSWKAKAVDFYNRFIELATDVNGNMPRFVIARIQDILNGRRKPLNGTRLHVLGVAYKRNVDDVRESPALEIMALAAEKGAVCTFSDPHVDAVRLGAVEQAAVAVEAAQCDLAVLVTDHDAWDYGQLAHRFAHILDCRNAFSRHGITASHIETL